MLSLAVELPVAIVVGGAVVAVLVATENVVGTAGTSDLSLLVATGRVTDLEAVAAVVEATRAESREGRG